MQYVIVSFPESRNVLSGGNLIGRTNERLALNGGTHTFTLSGAKNYMPLSQKLQVAKTSAAKPLKVFFSSETFEV